MKNVSGTARTILDIKKKYFRKLDSIDLDILIAYVIKKEREFVLAHPEFTVTSNQQFVISKMITRRMKNEPLAYILGEKEFYGLNFKVNRYTLIPRPETELMVDLAINFINGVFLRRPSDKNTFSITKTNKYKNIKTPAIHVISEVSVSERTKRFHGNTTIRDLKKESKVIIHQSSVINIIDIGTGSGNIIISLAHQLKNTSYRLPVTSCYGIDISPDALKIAKQNAKLNKVNKKIKFLHGNLLNPLIHNSKFIIQNSRVLILANLPYLSQEIYNACAPNVKKYESKSALYSANNGLAHYNKLLKQIKLLITSYQLPVTVLMEISPEQKKIISPLIKKYFPKAKIEFKKDLAQKWRICKVEI